MGFSCNNEPIGVATALRFHTALELAGRYALDCCRLNVVEEAFLLHENKYEGLPESQPRWPMHGLRAVIFVPVQPARGE